jgi:hypothetical protein
MPKVSHTKTTSPERPGLITFWRLWALGKFMKVLNKEMMEMIHCQKSVLKIQKNIQIGANLKFYIPDFLNFQHLTPEHSHK